MESSAQPLADPDLVVVGDPDGALAQALNREGSRARSASLHELGRLAGGHLVIVGKAAVDGGKLALSHAAPGTTATVVLPRGAAAARIAACSLGARVVEPVETAQLARAVLASLDAPPTSELGWTDLGSLLDALGERVALQLGAERSRGLMLRLGEADAVAQLLERFSEDVAEVCRQTRRPDSNGPSVAVAELSWDDDPQTQRLEDAEVARWRRLSARGEDPAPLRSDVVRASGPQGRLPAPGRLPTGVIPHAEEALTRPDATPLPLVRRHDPDIDETAPRAALADEDEPFSDDDLSTDDDTEIHAASERPAAPALPASERATVPERGTLPVALPAREALPPASPQRSKLPLLLGLGALAVGGVALVLSGLFAVGAFAAREAPVASPVSRAAVEPSVEVAAPPPATVAPIPAQAVVVEVRVEEPVAAPAGPALEESERRLQSDARVAAAELAERESDWARARTGYLAALELFEANPHAHAGLARERLANDDAEGALVHARRAVALRRRRAEYQVLVGHALRLAGDAPGARAAFDRALELDPENRDALRALSP